MRILRPSVAALFGALALLVPAPAQDAVGVILDLPNIVHVFDPDTHQITASVSIPGATFPQDVVIAPDLSEAYVAVPQGGRRIAVIDLEADPPTLAAEIPVSTRPVDLALTQDGRFLLVASSGVNRPLVVVDVQTRMEVSSFLTPDRSPTAVDVAPDGSVLIADGFIAGGFQTDLRRFVLDEGGGLMDTGDLLPFDEVPGSGANCLLVPSYPHLPGFLNQFLSRHTLFLSRHTAEGVEFGSLGSDGLTVEDTETLDFQTGIDLVFDPRRSIAYARTIDTLADGPPGLGDSRIEGYFFNPITGNLGPRIVTIQLDRQAGTILGIDQMALEPHSRRLFVSGLGAGEGVRVYNSLTGEQVGTIMGPGVPLSVAVRRASKKFPW